MEYDERRLRLLGNPDTESGRVQIRELFAAYAEDTRYRLRLLHAALDNGDTPRVAHLAHGQKGASGMVGAVGLASLFAAVERAPGDDAAVRLVLVDIASSLTRLEDEITAVVGSS